MLLTFTNHYAGVFTNSAGENGTVRLVIATNLFPATLSGRTLVATSTGGAGPTTLKFGAVNFVETSGNGAGTYSLVRYSPFAGMLTLTHTNAADAGSVSYLQVMFGSKTAGSYVATFYDGLGNPPEEDEGSFVLR